MHAKCPSIPDDVASETSYRADMALVAQNWGRIKHSMEDETKIQKKMIPSHVIFDKQISPAMRSPPPRPPTFGANIILCFFESLSVFLPDGDDSDI